MQYQSLIRLLEHCGIHANTTDAGKNKKILAAEFSLSENGIISIDGFDYTKNDVFRELEAENAAQIIEYHHRIWNDLSLLQCLEQDIIDFRNVASWFELTADRDFVDFISPYFSESFNKIMRKYLQEMNFEEAVRCMRMNIFIADPNDENRAYSSTRTFLTATVHELKNVNEVTYTSLIPELNNWATRDAASFLNRLPDSFFDVKHDLVNALINLQVLIQNNNRNLCYQISLMLVELSNLRLDVAELIKDNHRIFENNIGKGTKEHNAWSSYLWFIVVAVIVLTRFSTTCHDRSSRHKSYYQPQRVELDSATQTRLRAILNDEHQTIQIINEE
ncbi:MAG: hypothetical protein LBS25_02805 [Candidatus Symbiothrix sp.]|jgi:hypothetical protein|nr:hypothetical protein [Candidatus Symbiothrix sp.]